MELGEKLRQARLEAGLSQRQLCGEEITRNMLSLIENGAAKPSMKTLQYLASRLGKNVSYFLEESAVVSANTQILTAAREAFDRGDFSEAAGQLGHYQAPDPVYDREKDLLWALIHLELAEQALDDRREIYALELLARSDVPVAYCVEALGRRRLLLQARIQGRVDSTRLPSLDEELLLRAREAFHSGADEKAVHLLEAMDSHADPRWNLLRGELYLQTASWREAARCFHAAEAAYPRESIPRLEQCYRELEDYKRAYEYACKQK